VHSTLFVFGLKTLCLVLVYSCEMCINFCVHRGDLDTKSTDMVMRILIDLNRKHGITMIVVTHDIHLRSYADRILHLRDGKVKTVPLFLTSLIGFYSLYHVV
jgi:ABC-type enterochelin transport system ATPase subunit